MAILLAVHFEALSQPALQECLGPIVTPSVVDGKYAIVGGSGGQDF